MPRSKPDGEPEQAAFDFDTVASVQAAVEAVAKMSAAHLTSWTEATPVVVLADHRRARHLEVVRRLLAETGVFRVD